MDLGADSGTLTPNNTVGGPPLELELSLSSARCQTESGGTILLQLLEFKTHLLEAVEELHIRKDAETRFEDQISKLVLEKQELEWEKESLQRQIETVTNQHTESLNNVKKQFQAKIRNIEEEKGKHQISVELKDKEINNLKEELRALQLLKYNLEKKSNELEQKLALQSRTKDSHLSQLGEVEKRFSVLSRQCAMVKQAHEKLEQNVDEAMRINKKLTSANEKQEATIVSLKKELEEASNKLIKTKMTSVKHDKTQSHTDREQHIQKLHQKLNMETEMNRKLSEENLAVRAEKQEVMRSLQLTQQLLLSQTQTVNRVELELQKQREQCQALKQEHEVMRDKSKAVEDKVAQLMESYTASKTSWDKEKEMFLDCIKTEQQDLQAVKEAYDELHRKHTEVSSLAKTQAQHISELEMRNSSRSLGVSAQVFPLNEPISSSELPSFGSLQHLASSQTKNPDCLEDMVVAKLVATGATGGREALNYQKGMNEKKHGGKDDNNKKEEERNTEQQRDREEVQGDDVKERGSTGEKRRTLTAQTTDRADRREDSQGSSEDAEDTRSPETETRDRAEGQGTDGAEERVKTAVHTSETQILSQTTTDWTTEKSNARQVVDFTDSLSRKVTEMDAHSSHVNKGCGTGREGQLLHTLDSDDSQSVHHRPYPDSRVQNLRRDEVQTQNAEPLGQLPSQIHQVSEKTAEEAADVPTEPSEPLSHSRICTNAAPLAAQTETTTTQTAAGNPCVITCNMKPTDEMCDIHVNEESVVVRTWVEPQPLPKSQEISEQQNGQLRSVATGDGDSSEGQSNVDTQEDHNSETAPVEKSNYKDVCVDITMDTVDVESELESVNCQQHKNSVKTEEATERETDLKVSVHSTGPRSSCDLVSLLHQFVQGSEQNTSGSGGRLRHPPSAIPMFPKGKHSKVPLVITRVSDLLDSSSVSGNAASLTRHQQGEWKALGETCRETTAADTGSRASLSITSFPVSTSSSAVSELPWQATAGCSRAPTSAAGPVSESDWEPSCSQEREDQQSSIRAQISKIEQFLNTERLCLSKRRKTDN